MKKFVFVLMLLYPIQLFSQIKTGGSLELGYEDRTLRWDYYNNPYTSTWLNTKGFADIHLNADYKGIALYTNVKTYFQVDEFYSYDPFQVEYKIGVNYKVKRFIFDATHLCSHPIELKEFYETYDRFSLQIKLFKTLAPIKTGGSLELGYEDRTLRWDNNQGVTYVYTKLKNKGIAAINLNINYKDLSISTNVETYLACEKFYRYDPWQLEYKVGINYNLNRFVFSAAYLRSHSIEFEDFDETYYRFSVKIILFEE
jgi:outer membrane receptor protein involved in Fe transport